MFNAEDGPTSTPMERFQAKMPRLIEDFAHHDDPRFILGRDKLPSITSHQRTGTRRFEIRRAPWSTIKTALFLIDAVNPSGADQRSIYRQYENFSQCNSDDAGAFYDSDEMLCLFIIDIIVQGIKASSAETYMSSILRIAHRKGKSIKGPLVKDLRKILHMLRLDDEVDHAIDITEEQAATLLSLMSGEAMAICAMMLITGARVADLLNLEAKDIKWASDFVTVHFKCTKNRKNPNKVFTANYKLNCINLDCCADALAASHKGARMQKEKVFHMTVDDFNACIKRVWKCEWGEKHATSYSFRRLAIQRFVRQSIVEEDGVWVIKWARAMALTGHLRLETLRTRYLEVDFQTLEGAEIPSQKRRKVRLPPTGSSFFPPPVIPRGDDRLAASPFLPGDWSNED